MREYNENIIPLERLNLERTRHFLLSKADKYLLDKEKIRIAENDTLLETVGVSREMLINFDLDIAANEKREKSNINLQEIEELKTFKDLGDFLFENRLP